MRHFISHVILVLVIAGFHASNSSAQGIGGLGGVCQGGFGGFGGGLVEEMPESEKPCELVLFKSNVIVVGKVALIEEKPSERMEGHKTAVVKISACLKGSKDLKQIKIVFPVENDEVDLPPEEEDQEIEPDGMLKAGMEGCFYLEAHDSGEYYTMIVPVITSDDTRYKSEIAKVKKIVHVIDDPVRALKSQIADDRFHAALILIYAYRIHQTWGTNMTRAWKEIEISTNQSKRIFEALLEGGWDEEDEFTGMTGAEVFKLLHLESELSEFELDAVSQKELEEGNNWIVSNKGIAESENDRMKLAFERWMNSKESKPVIQRFVPFVDLKSSSKQ